MYIILIASEQKSKYNNVNICRKEEHVMPDLIKPGTDNQTPGTYIEVGPRGGEVSHAREVNIDIGDRLPPTQQAGHLWKKE